MKMANPTKPPSTAADVESAPGRVSDSLIVLLGMMSLLLAGLFPATAVGQDVGNQALSKTKYPWYDAESGTVKRIELGPRPGIESAARNTIPLKPVNPTKAPGTAGKFNTGSFFEGLSIVAWILIGVVIATIAAVLFYAFLRMGATEMDVDESAPGRSMEESIKHLPFEMEVESGDFRSAAQKAYEANDYRKAIIFLFSHVLVSLDQQGLIRLRKGKTNRQYLRELRRHRPLANYYQRVMVPFESTFFGDHDLEKNEFEHCWDKVDSFQKDIALTSQVAGV